MGQIQSLQEFLSLIRRRRLLIGLICGLGILLSVIVGLMQPKLYEATAVIQIESPIVDTTSEAAAMRSSAARRVQLIEQRLMVRDNLISVIERFGLYTDLVALSMNEKVDLLRAATRLHSIATVQQGYANDGTLSALMITATHDNAETAALVANDFAESVLEQSRRTRIERAREAVEFFRIEEARVGKEIAELESEIAEFKNENVNALPSALEDLRDQRALLAQSIREIDQQIVGLAGEQNVLRSGKQLRAVAQRQIEQMDEQISVLSEQRDALAQRLDEVESAIGRTPEGEMALNTFDRRLQQLQDKYDVISRRLAEAETSDRLEASQNTERFELLEPAIVPEYAVASRRKKIVAAGAMASLVIGFGVAFLLDLLNPVIRTGAQLQRQLELRPVVSIPYIPSSVEKRQRRTMRVFTILMLAAAILIAMTIAGVTAFAG